MRILLICESSYIYASGGRVVRYLSEILSANQNTIKLVILTNNRDDLDKDEFYKRVDVVFLPVKILFLNRLYSLFFNTIESRRMKNILKDFDPDIVHFASFDIAKPPRFIDLARKSGAKVLLQPWTMHFYCAQGFGFLNHKKCVECANGNFFKSISNNCVSLKGLPATLERFYLRKTALKANVFLSSNSDLDAILIRYGVKKEKIKRFPVPFDYRIANVSGEEESDYFIYYGQVNEHKGINVLLKIFSELPQLKLKIYPIEYIDESSATSENIEIINGINWKNGLKEALINAKAVVIPSLWSTSTEYAMCEALLYKKAVVVFNVGAHKELFRNYHNALVVEPDDYEGFKTAVLKLNEDDSLRKHIAISGYEELVKGNEQNSLYTRYLSAIE